MIVSTFAWSWLIPELDVGVEGPWRATKASYLGDNAVGGMNNDQLNSS